MGLLGLALLQYDWCPYEKRLGSGHKYRGKTVRIWREGGHHCFVIVSESHSSPFQSTFYRQDDVATTRWQCLSSDSVGLKSVCTESKGMPLTGQVRLWCAEGTDKYTPQREPTLSTEYPGCISGPRAESSAIPTRKKNGETCGSIFADTMASTGQ